MWCFIYSLEKLYHILETSENDAETRVIVSWMDEKVDPTNTSFVIHDLAAFEKEILPKYFQGTLASFKRQLNYYGFIRLHNASQAILLKDKEQEDKITWEYRHESGCMRKGQRELLHNICRRGKVAGNGGNKVSKKRKEKHQTSSTPNKRQHIDESTLLEYKMKVNSLEKEVAHLRAKMAETENTMLMFQSFMEQHKEQQTMFPLSFNPTRSLSRNTKFALERASGASVTEKTQTFAGTVSPELVMGDDNDMNKARITHSFNVEEMLPRGHSKSRLKTIQRLNTNDSLAMLLPRERSKSISLNIDRLNTNSSLSSVDWVKDIILEGADTSNLRQHSLFSEQLSRVDSLNAGTSSKATVAIV